MNIPLYVVDAFSSRLFAGNPAAVCPLEQWLPDEMMLSIAAENNLAETAFCVPGKKGFDLRWFTPEVEVDLCGHATLATAFVLAEVLSSPPVELHFNTRSGLLKVTREGALYLMDFPARQLQPFDLAPQVSRSLDTDVVKVTKAASTYIAELENEAAVRAVKPDFAAIGALECQGLIITAHGMEVDFVSRFFAPRVGIDEDHVTGSAHCGLIPYWHKKLGKRVMKARQLSRRGGEIHCEYRGDRVIVGGEAVLYSSGVLHLPPSIKRRAPIRPA